MSYDNAHLKTDLDHLVSYIGADVKENGHEMQFKYCPYCQGGDHKDQYTFAVNTETGLFNCMRGSCLKKGHFVELARDLNFQLDFIKPKVYKKFTQKEIKPSDQAIQYLGSRGISPEVVNRYKITTKTGNPDVLVFPFYDENNVLVFVKYRNTKYVRGKTSGNKEWTEKDTKPILFGMNQCSDFDRLIITEGQVDSLSVSECGIKNAVSVPMGMKNFAWFDNCETWINRFNEIIVFGDKENGKITLANDLAKRVHKPIKVVRMIDYLGEKDANDILRNYGKEAIQKCIDHAEAMEISNIKQLSDVKNISIEELPKLKTGISQLDRAFGGFLFGDLILITGKSGAGKSTLASQFMCEILDQDARLLIYSGEMSPENVKRWLNLQLAGNDNINEFKNSFGEPYYIIKPEAEERICGWYRDRAFIYENYSNEEPLLDTIEKAILQYKIQAVVVDNLMSAMEQCPNGNDLHFQQSQFVGKLKALAVKYNIVVILVVHPRKSVAKGQSSKNQSNIENEDISGSADIGNKADITLSVEQNESGETDNVFGSKISVVKNRHNGRLLKDNNAVGMRYSEKSRRFANEPKKYGWEQGLVYYDDIIEII